MKLNLENYIASIPNFPKEGILFKDISPLLANAQAWKQAVKTIAQAVKNMKPDILVGIESRGFLLSAPIAVELDLGFVMIRKKNKLPGDTVAFNYDLEYGSDTIEIQKSLIKHGQRVVILDDLLATGGTIKASVELLKKLNINICGCACIIELTQLKAREILDIPIYSLLQISS